MVLAVLLAATLSANPAGPTIGRDGRVTAPEGFRAQLPSGLRYSVEEQNGSTLYQAVDPKKGIVISVALGSAGDAAQCVDSGEVEAQPGVRLQITSFRTRNGLEGCLVRGRKEPLAMALAVVFGPERDVVAIAAIAAGTTLAERQARGVAETVAFLPRPPVDPRMLGCFFEEEKTLITSGAGLKDRITHCFLPDHRYAGVSARTYLISGGRTVETEKEGSWTLRAGHVEVQTEEGSWKAAVGFEDGDLVLDGQRWSREADMDSGPDEDAEEDEE